MPRLNPEPSRSRAPLRVIAEGVLAGLILAVPTGWLWDRLAPTVTATVQDAGDGEPTVAILPSDATAQFDVQAWFTVVTAGLAVLLTFVLVIRHRSRPVSALLAALLGSAGGSLVVWRLGVWLGPEPVEAALSAASAGDRLPVPTSLDAYVVLLVAPIVATAVVLFVTVVRLDPAPWRFPGTHRFQQGESNAAPR